MTTQRTNRSNAEGDEGVRDFADDIGECVRLVADLVIGNSAALVARVLRHVDQLVDDVVADAAVVAHEAEELFRAACVPRDGCESDGDGDPKSASL